MNKDCISCTTTSTKRCMNTIHNMNSISIKRMRDTVHKVQTIWDGIKAQWITLSRQWGDINKRLQAWVGTAEWPRYAQQVMSRAGIPQGTTFQQLSAEQQQSLQTAIIQCKGKPRIIQTYDMSMSDRNTMNAGINTTIITRSTISNRRYDWYR